MKKLLLVIVIIVLALLAWFKWQGGVEGLARAALPAFPELPAPATVLAADQQGVIYFRSSSPFDFDVLLNDPTAGIATTAMGTLFLPEQASASNPVPAMILLHGSGGISPGREMEYGQWLKDHGFAALVINYFLPRGATEDTHYMMRVISITEFDALADAYAGLNILSTHPAIDANRIGAMGFSYGGMATRFAMDERVRQKLAPQHQGFAAFVDFYGPCYQNLNTHKTNGAPLLTLRGTDDNSNDLEACLLREKELTALGVEVEAHIFESAGHAWEVASPRKLHEDSPYLSGCQINYDAQGHSMIDDQFIVNVPTETSREKRIVMRMTSGDLMMNCVKYGYIIGHDPATKAKSDRLLLDFLNRVFISTAEAQSMDI